MNFLEAEKYLLSLGSEVETMKLGLSNIRRLLSELGNPERHYLKVQVAGTNGKGSVCAFLDSICRKAGIKTGVYTSPHLISITERVRINGLDISEAAFARIATLVRETAESLVANGKLGALPTYFEQVTAIGLAAFAEARVELAILETGLGGRYDAVTAAKAEICAITRIALDHQEYLGDSIFEIAAEKAAIIRPDSKVVVGRQEPEAMASIDKQLNYVKDRYANGSEFIVKTVGANSSIDLNSKLRLGLLGDHQTENAEVAILITEILREHFTISTEDIINGLEGAVHPGRLEYIGGFLLDGAHNVSGAEALCRYLDSLVDKPITLIFGVMSDKNVVLMAEMLFPRAGTIILTRPRNPRSLSTEQLSGYLPQNISNRRIIISGSVSEAIKIAEAAVPMGGIILVTGSLYLVGEVRRILTQRSEQV